MENTTKPVGEQDTDAKSVVTKRDDLAFIKGEFGKVLTLSKEFNETSRKFIKNLINPDLTDDEMFLFLAYANKLQLNPFTKEIIAVVYNKNDKENRVVNTITTRNGKRVVAARTGELDSITSRAIYIKKVTLESPVYKLNEAGEYEATKEVKKEEVVQEVPEWSGGTLWGAEATVVRNGRAFTVRVPFTEYTTGKNVWNSKPSTMIKKVAESQVLSAAFPETLGAVYDDVEIASEPETIKNLPDIKNGSQEAKEEQLTTIESLGGDPTTVKTYGEAAQLIRELSLNKKGKPTNAKKVDEE